MLAWVSTKIFGVSAESLKLVSLVAGTATIPLTYLLGRRLVGARAGLLAAALVALSPFLIYYSSEGRPYALLVLLVLLATLSLLRALRTMRWTWWLAYAVFACAAAYTHFTSVFPLAGIFLWALLSQPQARRQIVLATAGAVVGFLPWLPTLIKTTRSPGTKLYQTLEPFSLHAIRFDLGHWAIGHPYQTLAEIPGSWAVLLGVLGVVLALAGVAQRWAFSGRRQPWRRPSAEHVLVAVLALAAPVGAALYSELRESVWGARNVIAAWPGFAVALAALASCPRLPWRIPATLLIVVAYAVGAVEMFPQRYHRPDYQDAVVYINRLDPHGPLADLVAPTPGPPSATEAALTLAGTSHAHPDFRIGLPPLKAVLAAAAAGNGLLFLVLPSAVSFRTLESTRARHLHDNRSELSTFATFLGALPARFRPETARTFTGFAPVTVYVYRG